MLPRITEVAPAGRHRLRLSFTDGVTATLDFLPLVSGRGGMLAQLEDEEFFARVRLDPEAGTIIWPNNVDFDPDVLHGMATGADAVSGVVASQG
jgi:hypothetical protein